MSGESQVTARAVKNQNTNKRRLWQNSWEFSSGCELDKVKHNLWRKFAKEKKSADCYSS